MKKQRKSRRKYQDHDSDRIDSSPGDGRYREIEAAIIAYQRRRFRAVIDFIIDILIPQNPPGEKTAPLHPLLKALALVVYWIMLAGLITGVVVALVYGVPAMVEAIARYVL